MCCLDWGEKGSKGKGRGSKQSTTTANVALLRKPQSVCAQLLTSIKQKEVGAMPASTYIRSSRSNVSLDYAQKSAYLLSRGGERGKLGSVLEGGE